MRILKIELQNINSLRCEKPIVIDFESEQFQDVGLFAITGSTGAGKTTLLDAICIGLYQSVPRFNQKNSRGNLQDVVSYGADQAMARITFQVMNGRYEAFWSMRLRQKGGKLLTNPREEVRLKDLNSERILAEKKTQLKQKVEEITQLNYQQFLRSVMLAQGEFAAFLSADNKDKGTLLEQITGEEIYKKIGEALGTRIGEERYKLEQVDKRINLEDLLSNEDKQSLKQEKEEHSSSAKQLDEEIQKNELILSWFKRQEQLDKSKEEIANRFVTLKEEENQFKPRFLKLKNHLEAEPFQTQLNDINRIEKDQLLKHTELKALKESITTQEIKLKNTSEQELSAKINKEQAENIFAEWQPKLETVAKMDTQIESHKEHLIKLNQEIKTIDLEINDHTKNNKGLTEAIEKEAKSIADIRDYLNKNKIALKIETVLQDWVSRLTKRKGWYEQTTKLKSELTTSLKKLENIGKELNEKSSLLAKELPKSKASEISLKDISEKLKAHNLQALLDEHNSKLKTREALRELHVCAQEFEDLNKQNKKEQEQKTENDKKIDKVKQDHEACNKALELLKQALEDSRKIVELESKIKGFEDERKKLVEGEPCSLCGSTEHPYVQEYADLKVDESRKELTKREHELSEKQKEEKKLSITLAELSKELEQLNNSAKEREQKKERLIAEFNKNELGLKIHNKDEILKQGTELKAGIEQLEVLIKHIQLWQKEKEEIEKTFKLETEKCNILSNEINLLKQDEKNHKDQLLGTEKEIEELEVIQVQFEEKLTSEMAKFKLELPEADASDSFVSKLNTLINGYKKHSDDLNALSTQLSERKLKLKHGEEALAAKLKDKTNRVTLLNEQEEDQKQTIAKRIDLLPLETTTQDKRLSLQESINTKTQKHEKLTTQLNQLTSQLSSDKNASHKLGMEHNSLDELLKKEISDLDKAIVLSGFNNRAEVSSALLEAEEKKSLEVQQQKLNSLNTELNALQKQNVNSEEELKAEKSFETNLDETNLQKKALLTQKDNLLKRLGEIQQKLTTDKEITQRNKGVVQEKREQEKVVKKYRDLLQLLGGSKHAFNTYVQRLTLKNLIALANRHLFKLNRRYSLKMNEQYKSGEELNFMLVDHYQTDETRLVDTSSGGEKFLISLSLALGLSDLASKNVSIGSLFIDEGFGTLDNATLETVIASLSTLQSQGKMIGVISHVENLKDRISTQIRVLKTKNGVSEVEII